MLALRALVFLVAAAVAGCLLLHLCQPQRGYLRLAGRILRFALVAVVATLALYVVERLVLI